MGVAEGVGSSYRSITGVGSGGLRVGVVLGVGVTDGVVLGVGVDGVELGSGVGVGVGVTDGLGSGVGVDGVADGVGVDGLGADGLGVGVGTTGLVSNPALPPDSRRIIRALTSQDLSWDVILATSVHGPGSVDSIATLSSNRAFSPLSNLTLRTALSLAQLTTLASMKRMY